MSRPHWTRLVGKALITLLLTVGTAQADSWTGAGADDNWSTNGNWLDGSPPTSTDSVTFNATDSGGTNVVDTNYTIDGLEYIGNGTHTTDLNGGSALQIDGPVHVGIGDGTNGGTATWTHGGSVTIGSAGSLTDLRIGINDQSVAGTNTGLFTIDGTDVTGFLSDLIVGWQDTTNGPSTADGTLVLGSNSSLSVGTPSARAAITLGENDSNNVASDATGVLNALDGTANLRVSTFDIGRSTRDQTATGTFRMGDGVTVDATTINIGTGTNAAGAVNLEGGLMVANTVNLDTGAFNFTGGRLAVGTFNGTLIQQGGTLAPGLSPGITTINGDYNLSSSGTFEIELFDLIAGSGYDQLIVNGGVDLDADLGSGGMLDVILGFAPSIGDRFTIIDNDGADPISGNFFGLLEGDMFTEVYGANSFTFEISYLGGTGNDVVLNLAGVASVPEPTSVLLIGSAMVGLVGLRRRLRL